MRLRMRCENNNSVPLDINLLGLSKTGRGRVPLLKSEMDHALFMVQRAWLNINDKRGCCGHTSSN